MPSSSLEPESRNNQIFGGVTPLHQLKPIAYTGPVFALANTNNHCTGDRDLKIPRFEVVFDKQQF